MTERAGFFVLASVPRYVRAITELQQQKPTSRWKRKKQGTYETILQQQMVPEAPPMNEFYAFSAPAPMTVGLAVCIDCHGAGDALGGMELRKWRLVAWVVQRRQPFCGLARNHPVVPVYLFCPRGQPRSTLSMVLHPSTKLAAGSWCRWTFENSTPARSSGGVIAPVAAAVVGVARRSRA